MNFALLAGLLAGTAPAAALKAQVTPSASDEPEIIVRGEAVLETDELRDAVGDIAMRGRDYKRPMARYQAPLCATVLGMGERMEEYVGTRIMANAVEAGLDKAERDCYTNALIIVTDDQAKLIERLRESEPQWFNPQISRRIRAALEREDASITWSIGRIVGKNGVGAVSDFNEDNSGDFRTRRGLVASRFIINYSIAKVLTVMVVDVDRLDSVHLDQLADFATMRILGQMQLNVVVEEERAATILSLFDSKPSEAPRTMTQLDRAYLKGLYAMRPNEPSTRLEAFVRVAYEDVVEQDCRSDCIGADPAPPPDQF
jgi:hypothetical protein